MLGRGPVASLALVAALAAASTRADDNAGQVGKPTSDAAQRASASSGGEAPILTGKERLGNKWNDEQRLDDCNVPLDKRGPIIRPDGCSPPALTAPTRPRPCRRAADGPSPG
jgi:hypothetical protein